MTNTNRIRTGFTRMIGMFIIALGLMWMCSSQIHAAKPSVEKTKYKGNGKVEVEFHQDVVYKDKVKVTVKDNKGKSYKVSILEKDDDELVFKVKNIKKGRTYTYKIKGVKKENTKEFKTVKGKFKVKKSSGKSISAAKAKKIALNHAGLKESQVRELEVESDTEGGVKIYEVSFETSKYEYDYDIKKSNGKILRHKKELND